MAPMSGLRVREMPEDERPRERFLRFGPRSLSDAELIAILIGTGRRGEHVVDVGRRLVALGPPGRDGLRHLADADLGQLTAVPGVGLAKAIRVQAALELGRRLSGEGRKLPVVAGADDVARLVKDRLRDLEQEHFLVVLLNSRNAVLSVECVSVGWLNGAVVHPREVFKPAVRQNAASVILVHNHPSGDPTPSEHDVALTARLVEAGRLLGVDVVDHLIIGDGRWTSLRGLGLIGPDRVSRPALSS